MLSLGNWHPRKHVFQLSNCGCFGVEVRRRWAQLGPGRQQGSVQQKQVLKLTQCAMQPNAAGLPAPPPAAQQRAEAAVQSTCRPASSRGHGAGLAVRPAVTASAAWGPALRRRLGRRRRARPRTCGPRAALTSAPNCGALALTRLQTACARPGGAAWRCDRSQPLGPSRPVCRRHVIVDSWVHRVASERLDVDGGTQRGQQHGQVGVLCVAVP